MWFCPLDGTLLQVRLGMDGNASSNQSPDSSWLVCSTCPYSCPITSRHHRTTFALRRKQVDDILGGAAAWEHVDRTASTCPLCNNKEAFFLQIQIRSADEPMSIFYKCVQCSHQWNDK
jgi:DNA-directed RNA polymerase III subunit RPC11